MISILLATYSTGLVQNTQKISDTEGGFTATFVAGDEFGTGVADIGDLNGDGVTDLLVGAYHDDNGGTDYGATYVLFMNSNGTVSSYQKISATEGGFTGPIVAANEFGIAAAGIGDLDGDGIEDIAVSERGTDDGGNNRGGIWILFLNIDGTVKAEQKITDILGGFEGVLDDTDLFGSAISVINDVNFDGINDLVVGAIQDDDGGTDRGAVWILQMNTNGTVNGYKKISDIEGGFGGVLDNSDKFGQSIAIIPDLNGDGIDEMAVGAALDDDGGTNRGAIWILFMNIDGTVASETKISSLSTNFTDVLGDTSQFGISVASLGDLDNDGVVDLVGGAWKDDEGDVDQGAVIIIFLNSDGSVKRYQKINDLHGGFSKTLDASDTFGAYISGISDMNGDGIKELLVGANQDDDGGLNNGAAYVLFLNSINPVNYNVPEDVSFEINSGDSCTDISDVVILMQGRNIEDYLIGNDPYFVGSDWEYFGNTNSKQVNWSLIGNEDEQTVYVLFRSNSKNTSNLLTQTINIDPDCDGIINPTTGISPVTGLVENLTPVSAGNYIRGASFDTVYYVDGDNIRHPFINALTYFTWESSFAPVKSVTDATLQTMALGKPMLPKPGVVLVKIESDPRVYAVEDTTDMFAPKLRWITSESLAESLYGANWADYIIDLPPTLFSRFISGNDVEIESDILVNRSIMKKRVDLYRIYLKVKSV